MTPLLWLQSERDYDTGRRIYEALGPNAHLKRTLSTGPNAYNREALAYELGKLVQSGVTGAVDVVPTAPVPAVLPAQPVPEARIQEPVPLHPLLDELKAQRPLLYDERRYLHAQLEALATDAERLTAALQIQDLSRQLNENWQLDAHVRTHRTPPVPPPPPAPAPAFDPEDASLATLYKMRANLRSNMSKWKRLAHREADLTRAKQQEQQLSARIEQLQQDVSAHFGTLKGKEADRG